MAKGPQRPGPAGGAVQPSFGAGSSKPLAAPVSATRFREWRRDVFWPKWLVVALFF